MGPFTAFAVCLRPGADIAFMVAASAAAAAPPATSSATPRSPVCVAVTVSDRLLAIATVIVPNCLQGLAVMVSCFIVPSIQPFIERLVKTAAISGNDGPAIGRLLVVGPSGKRPVAALFTASAASATASATAASTTALALFVFTITPWCGIGLGAVARVRLGSLADGTQAAGLVTPFTIAPFTPR
jgi:hypothetical protein